MLRFFNLTNASIPKTLTSLGGAKYFNSGFALIYNEDLKDIKKLDDRSLNIYHKSLKKRSMVKITNPENGKSLIAEVKSNRIKFSEFYNSIITERIVQDLDLNLKISSSCFNSNLEIMNIKKILSNNAINVELNATPKSTV